MAGKILVTGGAGYIGSHTCIELLNAGFEVVVVDNLCNSTQESLKRVEEVTGKRVEFHQVDLLNREALDQVFGLHKYHAVIHFAGLKAVGESVSIPLRYYHNNITGTLVLLELMQKYNVKKLVFSSSATVYGSPKSVPIREDFELSTTNPYGTTKLFIEQILKDLYVSDKEWDIDVLRYFNPIGAHHSGRLGEDPKGIPNNLMPYIAQVAIGRRPHLSVFGNDYPTKDGTGVRDYIHVVDLAKGHVASLNHLKDHTGHNVYNLGTGKGNSVLEVVENMKKVSGKPIPVVFCPRRPGDIAECYADPTKAATELHWKAEFEMERMCQDSWRWQSQNPEGYATANL